MANVLFPCVYWIFCVILLYIPTLSNGQCEFPLVPTKHETFMDYNGCGLFCDMEDAATPWTDRVTNKHISIIFLSFLIPAFLCNLIFTFNNINEHRENEETFATTPITYDALFVIDVSYLIVIICLILPHFSFFDGGNTVSKTYICNTNESTLSINGNNGLCTLFGLLIFSGFKIILIYTGMLCINIWYRLWKPMIDVGIKKRYLHGTAFAIVFFFDIVLIAAGGINANPSNGMCYIGMNDVALLFVLDIIPNVLFIIVSALSVAHAANQLKQELNILQQAALVIDDLVNLIHRMVGFLIMAVLGSAFVVFTQIIWLIYGGLWQDATQEWIHCTQHKMLLNEEWKYKYGDECIFELKDEGHSFPSQMFFIAFPIAALLSNIAIIVLTCHRRQTSRWRSGTVRVKEAFIRTLTVRNESNQPKSVPKKEEDIHHLVNSASPPSSIKLKSPDDNKPIDEAPHLSLKVRHSPQSSQEIEEIGVVRYKASSDAQDNDSVPALENNETIIRKNTGDIDKETAKLIELDRQQSEKKGGNKLEHISNASFDYHNIKSSDTARSAPLRSLLGIEEADTSNIQVTAEDMNKSNQVMGRIKSLQLDDKSERRDSNNMRSQTLPVIIKRSSTQKNFINFLDAALDDVKQREIDLMKQTSSKTSTRTVRFVEVDDESTNDVYQHNMSKKAADIILRSTTDSIAMSLQNKKKRKLKKSKTSIDAEAMGLDVNNITEDSPSPVINERRLSHKEEEKQYAAQVTDRQKRGFFDRFGRRKGDKDINKLRISKRSFRLRKEVEFRTSTGTPLHNPSKLLKPLTMELQWNMDTSYFDEETDTDTLYSSPDTFSYLSQDPMDHLDVLMHDQKPSMQWQSMSNVFHFTLTDNDFKSLLHNTFTPHSTRNTKTMTFDAQDLYAEAVNNAGIIKEDEEVPATAVSESPQSKIGAKGYTQSMDDIKCDQSVTAIGSDGRIVLSDIGRFKEAKSVPILNEEQEIEYDDDIKYDDDDLVKKINKTHHRTDTLHSRLLDGVPTADRKDLSITIHGDFSCEVAEKRKHFKAETAKLAFTLKPVHSMKILM